MTVLEPDIIRTRARRQKYREEGRQKGKCPRVFKDRNSLKVVSTQYGLVRVELNWYGETKRIRTEKRGGGKKKRDGENWLFVIGLVLCCLKNSLICWGDELSVLNFDRDLQREA